MVSLLATLLISSAIFLGWILLFGWPILMIGYIGLSFLYQKFAAGLIERRIERKNRVKEILHLLQVQKQIAWPAVDSSLELSCKDNTVGRWMNDLGVNEADGLKNGKSLSHSLSFPDSYDLVTRFLDLNISKNLNAIYRQASHFLRTGGTFVSLETARDHNELSDHILAANHNGFTLIDRSDLPLNPVLGVSQESWIRRRLRTPSIMMVWKKA